VFTLFVRTAGDKYCSWNIIFLVELKKDAIDIYMMFQQVYEGTINRTQIYTSRLNDHFKTEEKTLQMATQSKLFES
jgi:hypothetical protein